MQIKYLIIQPKNICTLSSWSTVIHALLAAFILKMVVFAIGVPPEMSLLAIKSAALLDGAHARM